MESMMSDAETLRSQRDSAQKRAKYYRKKWKRSIQQRAVERLQVAEFHSFIVESRPTYVWPVQFQPPKYLLYVLRGYSVLLAGFCAYCFYAMTDNIALLFPIGSIFVSLLVLTLMEFTRSKWDWYLYCMILVGLSLCGMPTNLVVGVGAAITIAILERIRR